MFDLCEVEKYYSFEISTTAFSAREENALDFS